MTQQLHIYGYSDDLIEITGAINNELDAEWGRENTVVITFRARGLSHTVKIQAVYGPGGIWRLTPIAGHQWVTITPAADAQSTEKDEHGCPGYSEKATITGDGNWIIRLESGNTDPETQPYLDAQGIHYSHLET